MRASKISTVHQVLVLSAFLSCMSVTGFAGGQWERFIGASDVRCLFRHADTLWIGTDGGIYLYDLLLEEFTSRILAGNDLPSNSVWALAGKGDAVMAGTDGGVGIFAPGSVTRYTGRRCRCFTSVRALVAGPGGEVVIGTLGKGVAIVERDLLTVYSRSDTLIDDKIYSLYATGDSLYFGTSIGLCALLDSTWVSYVAGAGLPRGEVRSIVPCGRGRFYLLVNRKGVYRFDGRRGRRLPDSDDLSGGPSAIAVDRDGVLWAAGRFGGIARFNYGTWTAVGDGDPLVTGEKWRSAYADSLGNVFFGSADGKIVWTDGLTLKSFAIPSGLPSNHVDRIIRDPQGGIHVLAGGVLLRWDGAFEREYTPEDVLAVAFSPSGELWVSTRWGIYRRSEGGFIAVVPPFRGLSNYVASMVFDGEGRLWVATYHGEIYTYDGARWLLHSDPRELGGRGARKLSYDSLGGLWALTDDGVSMLGGDEWRLFPDSLFGGEAPRDIAFDSGGTPILLTGKHLWRYRSSGDWDRIDLRLPHQVGEFGSLSVDGSGRLYVGTKYALILFDGENLVIWDRDAGIGGADVSSLMLDEDGYLWVGFKGDGLARALVKNIW
jgi:ligand-binding sensor domain-containing protein